MKTIKYALLFYPLYVILTGLLFGIFCQGVITGIGFGFVSYPIFWYTLLIMGVAGENGDDASKTGERANDNRR